MLTSSWPEPIAIGEGGGAWVFPDRAVLVTRTTARVPSAADVDALVDFFLWVSASVPTSDAPTIVHDWRSIESIPREVRAAFVRRRREIGVQPKRLVIAVTMSSLLRMALQTVVMGSQLVARSPALDLVTDPDPSLRQLGATRPDDALHARLRVAWRHHA